MSDNKNDNIFNKKEVNIDKESEFLHDMLFGSSAESDSTDVVGFADDFARQGNDNDALPQEIGDDSQSGEVLKQFSDFLTDSGEPKEEKASEDEISSHFRTGSYTTEDMPHFFTESSEYEDEQPLDVSDFYPPVKSEDEQDYDSELNTSEAAEDFLNTIASDSAEEPIDFDGIDNFDDTVSDNASQSDDNGQENVRVYNDSPSLPNDENAVEFAEEPAQMSGQTRVFDAINDDFGFADANTDANLDGADDDMSKTRAVTAVNAAAKGSNKRGEKKPNAFVRFLKGLFPWKGDPKKEVARKLVLIAAYITIIAMGWQILNYYVFDPMRQNALAEDLQEMYVPKDEDYSSPQINPKFSALYALNNDLVGWIKVRDTNIDYPVVKGETNEEYERHDFYHNYTRYGSIFMESTSSIDYGAESRNIVIYGHNMKDDSTMFSQLTHYRDFDFYKSHPTFIFDSLYNDGTWKIFSVMTTNAYPAQDDGKYFDYRMSRFADDAEFNSWIEGCRIRSCINTGVDVLPTDTVLTLQTCVYEFTDARLIIMARRARPGESKDVDVSKAVKNPNPRYPQAWYDAKGIVNPYADGKIPEDANYLPNGNTAVANSPYSYIIEGRTTATSATAANASSAATVTSSAATQNPVRGNTAVSERSNSSGRPSGGVVTRRTTAAAKPSVTQKPQSTTRKPASTTKRPASTTKAQPSSKPTEPVEEPETEPETEPVTVPDDEYEPNEPY